MALGSNTRDNRLFITLICSYTQDEDMNAATELDVESPRNPRLDHSKMTCACSRPSIESRVISSFLLTSFLLLAGNLSRLAEIKRKTGISYSRKQKYDSSCPRFVQLNAGPNGLGHRFQDVALLLEFADIMNATPLLSETHWTKKGIHGSYDWFPAFANLPPMMTPNEMQSLLPSFKVIEVPEWDKVHVSLTFTSIVKCTFTFIFASTYLTSHTFCPYNPSRLMLHNGNKNVL